MTCPKCQIENTNEARFCSACGTQLRTFCTSCGEEAAGGKFCKACGASIPSPEELTVNDTSPVLPSLGNYKSRWFIVLLVFVWCWYFLRPSDLPDLIKIYAFPVASILYIGISIKSYGIQLTDLLGGRVRNVSWWSIPIASIAWVIFSSGTISILAGLFQVTPQETRIMGGVEHALFSFIVLAPILEELLFRGLLFNRLSSKHGETFGTLASATAFFVMHVFSNPMLWPAQFCFGLLACCVYFKSKSLLTPMALHAIINLMNFLILIIFEGSQLKPSHGVVALLVSIPVLITFLVMWWPKGDSLSRTP